MTRKVGGSDTWYADPQGEFLAFFDPRRFWKIRAASGVPPHDENRRLVRVIRRSPRSPATAPARPAFDGRPDRAQPTRRQRPAAKRSRQPRRARARLRTDRRATARRTGTRRRTRSTLVVRSTEDAAGARARRVSRWEIPRLCAMRKTKVRSDDSARKLGSALQIATAMSCVRSAASSGASAYARATRRSPGPCVARSRENRSAIASSFVMGASAAWRGSPAPPEILTPRGKNRESYPRPRHTSHRGRATALRPVSTSCGAQCLS